MFGVGSGVGGSLPQRIDVRPLKYLRPASLDFSPALRQTQLVKTTDL